MRVSHGVRNAVRPMTKLAPMKSGKARKPIGSVCPRSMKPNAVSGRAETLDRSAGTGMG
jgi:hypothetical protein